MPVNIAWAEIAEKLLQAISLYAKAGSNIDGVDVVSDMAHLFLAAIIRHTSLLYGIVKSNGWHSLTLPSLVHSCGIVVPLYKSTLYKQVRPSLFLSPPH